MHDPVSALIVALAVVSGALAVALLVLAIVSNDRDRAYRRLEKEVEHG